MRNIVFKTENAVFKFYRKDVKEHLINLTAENNADEAVRLLKLILNASGETILIPNQHDYFGYIALDFIDAGKGTVTCKVCDKIYKADELEPIIVGHGRSPFDVNLKNKGGAKSLFRRKQKLPAMFGGKGNQCPEGHELIAMITWRT
jgi:hypothetical protein